MRRREFELGQDVEIECGESWLADGVIALRSGVGTAQKKKCLQVTGDLSYSERRALYRGTTGPIRFIIHPSERCV